MSGNLDRGLAIIELLAMQGGSLPLHAIADRLNIPRSGAHRLLTMLGELGYVRQHTGQGEYQLTLKLASVALVYLSASGVVDVAQPVLDRLATVSGELTRLGVIDGDRLVFVTKAQGARSGLRYDPDMGKEAALFCSANGHAWLSCLSNEEAMVILSRQGFGKKGEFGPNAPQTVPQVLKQLQAARKRGFGIAIDSFAPGMAAIAAPIRHPHSGAPIGVVSIAGPSSRLTEPRMLELSASLLEAATQLSLTCLGSPAFNCQFKRD
jgi:IclR family transcriptional regulator, negative regulator of allantoin and glyoxylate utilization operons